MLSQIRRYTLPACWGSLGRAALSYTPVAIGSVALFCCAPLTSPLFGGRSIIFFIVMLALMTLIFILRHISFKFVAGCALSILVLFLITMVLFLRRTSFRDTAYRLDQHILLHGFGEHVSALDATVMFIRDIPPLMGNLMYYATTVGQCFLHGFFEFFVVLQQKDPSVPWMLGRAEFDIVNRIWTFVASRFRTPNHKS